MDMSHDHMNAPYPVLSSNLRPQSQENTSKHMHARIGSQSDSSLVYQSSHKSSTSSTIIQFVPPQFEIDSENENGNDDDDEYALEPLRIETGAVSMSNQTDQRQTNSIEIARNRYKRKKQRQQQTVSDGALKHPRRHSRRSMSLITMTKTPSKYSVGLDDTKGFMGPKRYSNCSPVPLPHPPPRRTSLQSTLIMSPSSPTACSFDSYQTKFPNAPSN
eukprot:CAMPEP_0202703032 /NCGR_PEP_ID=MMETSP1385-20130828/15928_1 /ASSEMBLY_ACC=CAM_ASM_000861 /TAXON_ID=933848 /ORGANISM="Elphidium margaritaceum" /LENGTH=216 /DNA_ID=CAMNT_0049360813 /DNA_START=87 /DNA_END=737 /DNA_ORIENTATION=-